MLGYFAWVKDVWLEHGLALVGEDYDDWVSVPEGILGVVVFRETGRTLYDGADWYWYTGSEWGYIASGEWGTQAPFPEHVGCRSCVKAHAVVSDEDMERVQEQMQASRWGQHGR